MVEEIGNPWVYGILGAPRLVQYLSQAHIGTVLTRRMKGVDPKLEEAVSKMRAGDIIAFANERDYTHVVLYDGGKHIFCHTRCRNGDDKTTMGSHWRLSTLARYTCISIHDELAE